MRLDDLTSALTSTLARSPACLSKHGRPAPILGDKGLPSFEHEDGDLIVLDLMIAQQSAGQGLMLLSRWYGVACVLADDGMVPLHHHPGAWWAWRPCIHRRAMGFEHAWMTLGSQRELTWRHSLAEVMHARAGAVLEDGPLESEADFRERYRGDGDWEHGRAEIEGMNEAMDRADALLVRMLTPAQRIDLAAHGWFRCRGARTGNTYKIEPGNGFAILDALTLEESVSYCLHPEGWLPDGDVALATKLALEDPELEVDCLENARLTIKDTRPATPQDRAAWRIERDLYRDRELVTA